MAQDELRLNISATGAQQTAADLKGVAAAEGQVAGAASAGVAPAKAAGAAHEDLGRAMFGAHRGGMAFREMLSMLPPEMAAVVHGLEWTARASSLAGVGIGVLAVGIAGATWLINQFTEAQKKEREIAEQVRDALVKQRDVYTGIVDAVEEARLAQVDLLKAQGIAGITATQATGQARGSSSAWGGILGRKGVDELGAMLAAAGNMSQTESDTAALWLALGKGKEFSKPGDRAAIFRGQLAAGGGTFMAGLQAELRASRAGAPEVYAARAAEERGVAAGATPAGAAAITIDRVLEDLKLAGTPMTREELERIIRVGIPAAGRVARRPFDPWHGRGPHAVDVDTLNAEILGTLLERAPDLGGVAMGGWNEGALRPAKGTEAGVTIHNMFVGTHYHQQDRRDLHGRIEKRSD